MTTIHFPNKAGEKYKLKKERNKEIKCVISSALRLSTMSEELSVPPPAKIVSIKTATAHR